MSVRHEALFGPLLLLGALAMIAGCEPAGTRVARGSPSPGITGSRAAEEAGRGAIRIVDNLYPHAAYCRLLGHRARPLDIAHWLGTDAACKPIKTFEPGRIYAIAFWASWCPRCRETLPLLAAASGRFAPGTVTVVAVSHEEARDVEKFLAAPDEAGRIAAEAARHCCLSADPDESVHRDYMEAVDETGIPTVFVVGREGLIEWIGHPADMEGPLADVVAGRWDREAFVAKRQKIETIRARMAAIVEQAGGADAGKAAQALRAFAAEHADDAADLNEMGWLVVEFADGKPLPADLVEAAVGAVGRSLELKPLEPNTLDTLAHLQAMQGRLDEAIATQSRAVEQAGPDAPRFAEYLRELRSRRPAPE